LPAETVAAAVLKLVALVDPESAESISNCSEFDVPPPGAGV
jgi:hypothetical protein